MKKQSGSSPHERRIAASDLFTKPLSKKARTELEALRAKPDSEIDFSDIPEITQLGKVSIGRFYRPVKKLVSVRIDADVLEWFRSKGGGYQTEMNAVLRREMESGQRTSGR